MFKNQRYATAGIQLELPIELQLFLWNLIDNLSRTNKLDYLQVFELTAEKDDKGQPIQKIVHKQEQPLYKKTYQIVHTNSCHAKIFVIDDETHSTMLLAQEY